MSKGEEEMDIVRTSRLQMCAPHKATRDSADPQGGKGCVWTAWHSGHSCQILDIIPHLHTSVWIPQDSLLLPQGPFGVVEVS